MNSSQSSIIRRVLKENRVTAERVLEVLVQTLMRRHVDCELRKRGKRVVGQERPNSLVATMDSLHEYRYDKTDPQRAELQEKLFQMLTEIQITVDHEAGLDKDDDEPPTHMRLVRD